MRDLLTTTGAYVVYGSLLAFAGGVVGNRLQHRRDRKEADRQRAQNLLLELLDIILPIRAQWIGTVVMGGSAGMTTNEMRTFAEHFYTEFGRASARSNILGDELIASALLIVSQAFQFWSTLDPRAPQYAEFKAEITTAFDNVLKACLDTEREFHTR